MLPAEAGTPEGHTEALCVRSCLGTCGGGKNGSAQPNMFLAVAC